MLNGGMPSSAGSAFMVLLLLGGLLVAGCLGSTQHVCSPPGEGEPLAATYQERWEWAPLESGVHASSQNGGRQAMIVSLGELPADSAPPRLKLGTQGVQVGENETGLWLYLHVTTNPTDGVIDAPVTPRLIVNLTEQLAPGLYDVVACMDGDHGTRELADLPFAYTAQLDTRQAEHTQGA